MSWLTNIQQDLVIVTGDGKRYTPSYFNASVSSSLDFNVSKFEFVGVQGSLVDRAEPMGQAYDIEIMFDGADNLTTSDAFKKSSKDKRAWNINHPIYGGIVVQPLGLKWDNSAFNVTTITGGIVETINAKLLTPTVSTPDKVTANAQVANVQLATNYATDVPTPKVSDITALKNNINAFFATIQSKIASASDFENYFNAYNQINGLLNNTVFDTLTTIGTAQAFIAMPALFTDTVLNRIGMLASQLAEIGAALLSTLSPSQKRLYENNCGTLISSICVASVTNIGATDYQNRTQVYNIITLIISQYNAYLVNLSALQTDNGGTPTSYIPNPDGLSLLDSLVYFTVASLFDIANNAQQERTYILPEDSNVIVVAYNLYGLLPDDSTITTLIANNNIVGYELMQLKKGRELIYYV